MQFRALDRQVQALGAFFAVLPAERALALFEGDHFLLCLLQELVVFVIGGCACFVIANSVCVTPPDEPKRRSG
jgi:hypothetical protein